MTMKTTGLLLLALPLALASCNDDDHTVDYTKYYAWRDRNTAAIDRIGDHLRSAGPAAAYFADSVASLSEPYTPGPDRTYSQPSYYHVLQAADEADLRARHRWFTPFFTSTLRCHYTLYDTESVLDRLERTDLGDLEAMDAIFLDGQTDTLQSMQVEYFENFTCAAVVKGWADLLQQMHEGDSWVVAIPWQLGYGQAGQTSGGIAPYSALFFRIQLVDIIWWGGTVDETD